ncbi:MAG: acyl-CoA thioesterase [Bacteroidaceae bacterium]|mgnify:CR=1 FL=1|nr:acyl-CoA thioesterase [Bacteroidaceae bacterium]
MEKQQPQAPAAGRDTLVVHRFRHATDIQIRFNDVDSFGHVNNNAYFEYYDLGKERYLNEVLNSDFRQQEIVPVIANINANFIRPIFHTDHIEVETAIVHVGNKSFTLVQQAVNKDTGTVHCQCTTVMVCFDTATQTAREIPATFRKAIEEYEADNLKTES